MTSRPLFISVAESIVIFGPIDHVGWAGPPSRWPWPARRGSTSEWSTRAGDHHAPEVLSALAAQALGERRVLGVDRDQPFGFALHRSITSSPPTISDSLLARARNFPDCRAARVGAEPRRADHGVQDHVGLGLPGEGLHGLGAGHDVHRAEARELGGQLLGGLLVRDGDDAAAGTPGSARSTARGWSPPPSPTTRNRSGLRRTTSSAWVPMEPVDPRIASDRMRPDYPRRACCDGTDDAVAGRFLGTNGPAGPLGATRAGSSRGSRRPVPRTAPSRYGRGSAVAGEDRSHVLHPRSRLAQRLGQVAERAATAAAMQSRAALPHAGERVDVRRTTNRHASTRIAAPYTPSRDFSG